MIIVRFHSFSQIKPEKDSVTGIGKRTDCQETMDKHHSQQKKMQNFTDKKHPVSHSLNTPDEKVFESRLLHIRGVAQTVTLVEKTFSLQVCSTLYSTCYNTPSTILVNR